MENNINKEKESEILQKEGILNRRYRILEIILIAVLAFISNIVYEKYFVGNKDVKPEGTSMQANIGPNSHSNTVIQSINNGKTPLSTEQRDSFNTLNNEIEKKLKLYNIGDSCHTNLTLLRSDLLKAENNNDSNEFSKTYYEVKRCYKKF